MKPRILFAARLSFPLATALAALLASGASATAQTNNYFGTTGTLSGSVWSTNPAGPYTSALNSTGGAIINFGNATTTITGASITVAGINATANATVTTAGGTISNFANGVIPISVASGITLNFGGQSFTSSATAGYIKNGAGILALAGNTYAGGFTLNAGTVAVGGVNALGAGGSLTINGGTIRSNSTAARDLTGKYTGGITIGGDFTLGDATNNGALTFTNNMVLGAATRSITVNSAASLGGIISGSASVGLTKTGAGTLTLSGANTYTGPTTVSLGTLSIASTGALPGFSTNGSYSVTSGATLAVYNAVTDANISAMLGTTNFAAGSLLGFDTTTANRTYSVVLTDTAQGALGLNKVGGNTLTIDQANTFTGPTIVSAGTLSLTGSLNGGGAVSTSGAGVLTQSSTGVISGASSFTQGSSGTSSLSGANTFSGSTTINAGILSLGNVNALQNTSGITMATGSTLRPSIVGPFPLSVPITTSGSVTIGAPTVANGGQTFNEFILNGVIDGPGNVTFNNTNNVNQNFTVTLATAKTYTGTTTINNTAGTAGQMFVKLGVNDALPTTTVLSILGNAGAGTGRGIGLNLFGFNQTLAGLTNTAASLRVQQVVNSDASAAATLTINGTTDTTFSGNLGTNFPNFSVGITPIPGSTNGNNFALTKNGSGTFTLSGANTYIGATRILGGILSLGNASALSQSPLDTFSSIAGDLTNGLRTTVATQTMGGLTGNKNLASVFTTTSGGFDTVTALTLNPVTGATPAYSGVIADGAVGMTLTKTGAGTQTLGGANTFTGATSINAGALTLDYSTQDNSKLSDTAALTLGTATLDLSGGTHLEVVDSTTLTAGTASKVTRSSGSAILQMNAITTGAFASIDFGAAGIATTDTLNNAYGILGPWATIGGIDFAVNSTNAADGLITAPTSTDVARLDSTPALQIIADAAASNVRIVEGSGSPANLTLAAATTTINTLTQSASGGSGAATIDSGTQTLLTNAILVGTGAGALTIGNGSLGTATAGGDLALVNTTASGFTINSVIANNTAASTLSKLGTGLVTLTNANTYTGATTISAGTLQLGAGGTTGSLDTTGAIVLANSGNLTINRSNAVTQGTDFSGAPITGTGSFTQAGTGTTTLNAINTYSGSTTIGAGILNANSTDALGSGITGNTLVFNGGSLQAAGTITSPSTRALNFPGTAMIDTNGNPLSFAGSASGVGGLTKNGTGVLTFSALNSFTGPITINGGELVFSSGATGATYGSTQININNGSTLRITGATGNQSIYDGRNYTFDASGGGSILVSTGNYNAVSTPFSITTNGGAQNTIGLITTSGTFGFNLGSTTCTFDVALGTDPSSDLTVTPIIANTGSVLKTGAGRLTFTGANTYSGGTTINAGTLRLVGGNAITGVVTLGDFAGATLQVVNSEGVNGISGGGASGGTVSIDAAQVLSLVTGTHAYAGAISGAGRVANTGAVQTLNGALSQTGGVSVSGGTLTLGSSSNTYTGTTDISAATAGIVVTANGALGATGVGNETTVGANGVLGFSGGINYSAAEKVIGSGAGTAPSGFAAGSRGFIQSVSGNNTFAGDIELSANGNSRIGTQDGAQLTLTGAITQGTGITTGNILFRTGNLNNDFVTLSGTGNSFGGDSSVFNALATPGQYAGLRIGIDNAHPTNLTVQNFSSASGSSTALDLNGNDQALNGLASGGAGSLNVINLDTVNASTLTLNPTVDKNSGANIVILGGSPGGTALGDINLVKDGGFNQTLSGVNTYTGTTTINAGTLTINEGSIASSSGIANNAALVYNLTTNARTYANVISGSGTLTKSGTNTLTLSGANTYTGNTVVSAGTLALADNAQLKFVTGATSGTNNGISGAGTVTFDGDFVIDTTLTDASVLTTGTWTLVDASTLAETFNPSFTILGAGWSETANVWTKTVGSKKYTFTEATGILALSSAASYASWIDGFGLTGPDALATADPDFDGIDNAVEMVIGGNPATGMDTALLPTIELVNADPDGDTTFTDYLLFTYRRSDLSVAAGVTADGETDTDLAGTWTAATGAPGVVIQVDNNFAFTPPAAADTDRVRVYVPRGANPALFGRLKVVVP